MSRDRVNCVHILEDGITLSVDKEVEDFFNPELIYPVKPKESYRTVMLNFSKKKNELQRKTRTEG